MGLKNQSEGSIVWARISDGKIYTSDDKGKENPYNELEGVITDLYYKDEEFKGEKIRKLNVKVNDGETTYVLSMRAASSYAASLIGFLKNVDLSRTLTLSPAFRTDKDGKETRKVFVSQDGQNAKSFYTKATPNGLPEWESVKVGNKVVTDNSAYNDFLENVVTNELKPQLGSGVGGYTGGSSNPSEKLKAATTGKGLKGAPVTVEDEDQDLPF